MMQYLKIRVFYKYLLIVKSLCGTGVGPCRKTATPPAARTGSVARGQDTIKKVADPSEGICDHDILSIFLIYVLSRAIHDC